MTQLIEVEGQVGLIPEDGGKYSAHRSNIYKFFSQVFAYPSEEIINACYNAGAYQQLSNAAQELPFEVSSLTAPFSTHKFPNIDLESLRMKYTSLFDNCNGKPIIAMHERHYLSRDNMNILEELVRIYDHFGLYYEQEKIGELPDQLTIQLEFLHYLSFLETGASVETMPFIRAQADFLERHVAKWVPLFNENICGDEGREPYSIFSKLLLDFISADADYMKSRVF